jgi:hypothetical protein
LNGAGALSLRLLRWLAAGPKSELTMKYFHLVDDLDSSHRWHLDGLRDSSGVELDSRDCTYGVPMECSPCLRVSLPHEDRNVDVREPLRISRARDGNPLDFTFSALDMPVVTTDVANIVEMIAGRDIQRFKVQVDGQDAIYNIINVIARLECIDTSRSTIMWWETGNDIRPDLAGTPRMITELRIDAARMDGHHLVRPAGWEVVIIVSEVIKRAFEAAQVTGVVFQEV